MFALYIQINNSENYSSRESTNSQFGPVEDHESSDFQTINLEQLSGLYELPPSCSTPVNTVKTGKKKSLSQDAFTLTPVSEDFIKTFVTPKKARKVHDAMALEKEAHRCALKILRCFFTKEELKSCNTSGTNEKDALDGSKLNALKGEAQRNYYHGYAKLSFPRKPRDSKIFVQSKCM